MAAFIGLHIVITLKDPPDATVRGLVADVHPETSSLVLKDATFPEGGHYLPFWTVAGTQIADISVVGQPMGALQGGQHPAAVSSVVNSPVPSTNTRAPASFVDPAIVGFQKSAGNGGLSMSRQGSRAATNTGNGIAQAVSGLNISNIPHMNQSVPSPSIKQPRGQVQRVDTNTTRSGQPMDDTSDAPTRSRSRKNARNGTGAERSATKKSKSAAVAAGTSRIDNTLASDTNQYKGKGWRETPILQSTLDSPRRGNTNNDTSKKQRQFERDAANSGWATEDATDAQDMPEFDFIGNLSKFDKKSVWDEMRREDDVSESDRLAGHNKVKYRPGTYGGRNLHPSEMVLSPKMQASMSGNAGFSASRRGSRPLRQGLPSTNNDDVSDDSVSLDERALPRSASRVGAERQMSNSGTLLGPRHSLGQARVDSSGNLRGAAGLGVSPSLRERDRNGTISPPKGLQRRDTAINTSISGRIRSAAEERAPEHRMVIKGTERICPVLDAGQMDDVSQYMQETVGLLPGIINENAGRTLADFIVQSVRDAELPTTEPATVLLIVGPFTKGARALVAARHLITRGYEVLVCTFPTGEKPSEQHGSRDVVDGEEDYAEAMAYEAQCAIYTRIGGQLHSWSSPKLEEILAPFEASAQAGNPPPVPFIVLDALADRHGNYLNSIHEQIIEAQGALEWVEQIPHNVQGFCVVSIDGPSTAIYDEPEMDKDDVSSPWRVEVVARPSCVLALGAPSEDLFSRLGADDDWPKIFVGDVGVNPAFGTVLGISGGVEFGDGWFVEVERVME